MLTEEILCHIKRVMKEKKITQEYLAEQLGVSQGTVSLIMNGKSALTVNTLLQIAKVLEVDPASLIPSSEDGKPKQSFEDYIRSIIRDECGKDRPTS